MQQTTTKLPAGGFTTRDLRRLIAPHGAHRRNSAIQIIARTAEQTDALVYAAVDAVDYDTRQPTVCAIVLAVTVEHLPDGDWVTITRYIEDESPAQATCPQHVLAQLGEARTIDAQTWRARCQHFIRSLAPGSAIALPA